MHDPHARGCLFGLNLRHTRGDVYRAVLEGIANGVRHVLDTYAEVQALPLRIAAVGGGTMNRLWLQAVSDCGSCSQDLPVQTIGASFGSALLAGVGAGVLTPGSIRDANPVGERIVPDASTKALYDQQHRLFLNLYTNTRDLLSLLG